MKTQKKRFISLVLALALLCVCLPQLALPVRAEETSGACGDNLTWRFDESTGKLTISGSGEMSLLWGDSWDNYMDQIKEVSLPDGLLNIDAEAFLRCGNLKSVTIPAGLKTIGRLAFGYCTNLKSVTIPDSVEYIGNGAFSNCSSLTSVSIPGSVRNIAEQAFQSCSSLTNVTILNGVTEIGPRAFLDCNRLTSVTIPNSVTDIGVGVFSGCSQLNEINVNSGNPSYCSVDGVLFTKDMSELIQCPSGKTGDFQIPDNVTGIYREAFSGCSSLVSVTIPDSVTTIGAQAFMTCSSLKHVRLSAGLTSIPSAMFQGCSSLTSVAIPEGVTYIGQNAFYGCSSLTSVTIPDGVTTIDTAAFEDCTSLTSVAIPDSVTTIRTAAFEGCSSLTGLIIPGGVTDIAPYTFKNCTSLSSVTIPDSVTGIYDEAFSGCSSMTSVTIPDSVTTIGKGAFLLCSSLTSVTIPHGVTEIEDETFSACRSLTSVTIPDSVTSIGYEAFSLCGLTSMTIPDSVTTIVDDAFYACRSLTNVIIPDSVTSIGSDAFYDCSVLTSVTVLNRECSIYDDICTLGDPEYTTIYGYADSTAETYAKTYGYRFKDVTIAEDPCEDGHDFGDWKQSEPPTCTWDGREIRTCSRCGAREVRTLTALGHAWDQGSVTVAPTQGSEGVKTFTCTRCGETRTEAIPKLDPSDNPTGFIDVPSDAYYAEPVAWAVENGVTNGVDKTHFGPNQTCTRGQVATFLWRANGSPAPASGETPFTDVNENAFYAKAVAWAVENKVTSGMDRTHFGPGAGCTRGQVVTFLWRTAGCPEPESSENPFADVKDGAFYYKAVLWAVEQGITNGMTKTAFAPDATCTRGQIVTFLYRAMEK